MLGKYSRFSSYYYSGDHRALHSFPTRRSSDLVAPGVTVEVGGGDRHGVGAHRERGQRGEGAITQATLAVDRKSTRLNSSHMSISYAVFCLKKKTCSSNITSLASPYRKDRV